MQLEVWEAKIAVLGYYVQKVELLAHWIFVKNLIFKLSRQVLTRNGEVLKLPFNPKKETIVGSLDMFIELYNVAGMAGKKFRLSLPQPSEE